MYQPGVVHRLQSVWPVMIDCGSPDCQEASKSVALTLSNACPTEWTGGHHVVDALPSTPDSVVVGALPTLTCRRTGGTRPNLHEHRSRRHHRRCRGHGEDTGIACSHRAVGPIARDQVVPGHHRGIEVGCHETGLHWCPYRPSGRAELRPLPNFGIRTSAADVAVPRLGEEGIRPGLAAVDLHDAVDTVGLGERCRREGQLRRADHVEASSSQCVRTDPGIRCDRWERTYGRTPLSVEVGGRLLDERLCPVVLPWACRAHRRSSRVSVPPHCLVERHSVLASGCRWHCAVRRVQTSASGPRTGH